MRNSARRLSFRNVCVAGPWALSLALSGCSASPPPEGDANEPSPTDAPSPYVHAVNAAFPSARTSAAHGRVSRVYGSALATGTSALESAERFRRAFVPTVGADADDLAGLADGKSLGVGTTPRAIGLMVDEATGQPKFWLYQYAQTKGGVPVYGGTLSTLVRNGGSHEVVWASSTLRDVKSFAPVASSVGHAPDPNKALDAIRGSSAFQHGALRSTLRSLSVSNVSAPEPVVFAGTDEQHAAPRAAVTYTTETAPGGKWRIVADAATGDVLHVESLVHFANVTGTVQGRVTEGNNAIECHAESVRGFPAAEINGPAGAQAFADDNGNYTLTNPGTTAVTVSSPTQGRFFRVTNVAGTTETLSASVVPPGPANFLHDSAATDPLVIAQANGYAQANEIRSFLLRYIPNYPVIATQTAFPVNVNLPPTGLCPGNAYYDGISINFCINTGDWPNMSFASVNHHEYGHHIVNSAGSGQGEYGEGMSDAIATLFSGDPRHSVGFIRNDCTTPMRSAENTCQLDAVNCSSCGNEIHVCGTVISGTIWRIRQELAVTNPTTFQDIINRLTLSSIPLHFGTSAITSQIAIDLLTLDDNDGNLSNGTPHRTEICTGFSAHGMACPQFGANTAPTAKVTDPTNGASFPAGSVLGLTAEALDLDGTVTSVSFFRGTTFLGTDTTRPFFVLTDVLPNGSHALTARATDNNGAVTTSTVVNITVGSANPPPSVSITSPANNATFTAPATFAINANASDSNGTVTSVSFFRGSTLIGTDTTSPYSVNVSSLAAGSYALTAQATDNGGATTTSAAVNVTVGSANQPPSVSITSPANNATFTAPATFAINANASDSNGTVTSVSFFRGTTLIGTDTTSPYSVNVSSLAAGSYALTAQATDNGGATTTSAAVNVTVGSANPPPSVSITSPANNATFTAPATFAINANASDSNGTVTSVSFFRGTTLIGTDTTSPYSVNVSNLAAGSYALTAQATDNGGATTTSAAVNVTVGSANQPPSVSITSPANNATFTAPATFAINANASDSNGTVTSVSFFRGTTLIGTDTTSPYSVNVSSLAAGSYALTAQATDNGGATTTSAAVNVTVGGGGATACASLCASPIVYASASFSSGNLGTNATCHETMANLAGLNCGNFATGRTFQVNGTTVACNGGNVTLPAKRNGGYCMQASAGDHPWAYFTSW